MPHRKTWGALAPRSRRRAQRFGLDSRSRATVVGTVPSPQHMYGLESTVLLAPAQRAGAACARPFYPRMCARRLRTFLGNPCCHTPVHLRALLAEDTELAPLKLIICATAPLSPELAAQAEAHYAAPLHEIYGFTEAGMVASRRTVQGPSGSSLPDLQLRKQGDQVL